MAPKTNRYPSRWMDKMSQMGSRRQKDSAMATSQIRSSQRGTVKGLILLLLALCGWPNPAASQTYTIMPAPYGTVLDNSGNIVNAGCVWTYLAGGTTPTTTYTTSSGTANANPIIADSAGRFVAYLTPGTSYKFTYENVPCSASSHGTVLKTQDNIAAVPVSGLNVDVDCTVGVTVAAGDLLYVSDGSNSLNDGQCYLADADLFYASIHPVLGFATAAITSGTSGTIRVAGRITGLSSLTAGDTYYVSATAGGVTATAPANARSVGQALSTTSIAINIASAWILDAGQNLNTMDGRLTLTTALPVTVADVTAAATIYYTPYKGNRVTLFDGSRWKAYSFSELSLTATCTASNMYDIWVYDNAGTLTLESLIWTNTTTRATALVLQNGVNVKTGATTRRYVGSFYCTATNQTEDSFARRMLWNYYNRVRRPMRVLEATDTWTYGTTTYRQANAAATNQLDFVVGVAEVELHAEVQVGGTADTINDDVVIAIGLDSTTTPATGNLRTNVGEAVVGADVILRSVLDTYPTVGRHIAVWLELADATWTFYGDNGGTTYQSGMTGVIEG